jgi:glucose-6-phosphate dehydrogenase assembly protein OpcA
MIQLEKTFDVAAVEEKLAELWSQTTAELEDDESTVLRARVANLMVFVSNDAALKEVADWMQSLTAAHPGRVLLLLGDRTAPDRDIEMSVMSLCQTDKRTGAKRLCGEEVTLKAQGKFVIELPSAAAPLLVSDLSTFLCWRDVLELSDPVLKKLLTATDRLVIDSVQFASPAEELIKTSELFEEETYGEIAISDLNWERLTLWRALLADFYDVPAYQPWLDKIVSVHIDFVAPEFGGPSVAPQALLIVGWLASRLGWTINRQNKEPRLEFTSAHQRTITVEFNNAKGEGRNPGRLVHIELRSNHESPASFVVTRSKDNRHILAEAHIESDVQRGRLLPVRNRSTAQLLAREMEILSCDRVYQEAVAQAVKILNSAD